MAYIHIYLIIGIISLVIIFTSHLLSKDRSLMRSTDELLNALDPNRKKISFCIINFIARLMAATLIVVAWPVAIYMKISELRKAKELIPRDKQQKSQDLPIND